MTIMFASGKVNGDPPLDALCYRTPQFNDTIGKGLVIKAGSGSLIRPTRNSIVEFHGSIHDKPQLGTGHANPSGDNSQLDIVDLHEIAAHDVDKPMPEGHKIGDNGNHNDNRKLSRRQTFFSFFKRSNKKSVPSIPQKRTWPFMTSASGDNIAGMKMDSETSSVESNNTHRTEANTKRRGSLLGILFSTRQKPSKYKARDICDRDPMTATKCSETDKSDSLIGSQSALPSCTLEMDEAETGCLGCSNCDNDNKEMLTNEESICPVDSANDYLAALQDLLNGENQGVDRTKNENVQVNKHDITCKKVDQNNANDVTSECGIFKKSDEPNAKGTDHIIEGDSDRRVRAPSSQMQHEPLPTLLSYTNIRSNIFENTASSGQLQPSNSAGESTKNTMSATLVGANINDLNAPGHKGEVNTATINNTRNTQCDENVLKEKQGSESVPTQQPSKVRKRAMSEASIFKFSPKKLLASTSKSKRSDGSDRTEELYPVGFDDVAVGFEPNSGAVRFYLDRQEELPLVSSCDNRLDSLVEEDHEPSDTPETVTNPVVSARVESINELSLAQEANQSHNMDQSTITKHQPDNVQNTDIVPPMSPRKSLGGRIGKNMDKPKVKELTSSPTKIRSRSGSLPVLYLTKDSSDMDQSFGLRKLEAIDEMDSEKDESKKDKNRDRQRKRSVFSGPGKLVEDKSRNKVRRAKTSAQETKVAMFARRTHGDVKKSAGKVLDPKKDTGTRLKHLRNVLESYDVQEAKNFFEQNYSHVYYIFYDVFITTEADLKQRANKTHKEELDTVLYIFEKVLTLLPDLIHKRWQYHSIGRLMKKLLHSGNSIKLRQEGMRLFLLWYQILMDNATDECHKTFASLVPKLNQENTTSDIDIFTVNIPEGRVTAVEINAMLPPQSGEKQPDNQAKYLLESLLNLIVSETNKVEWNNKEMHEYSFNFLFNKFKKYYLHSIFPNFDKETSIYDPKLDLPERRDLSKMYSESPVQASTLALLQETVVKWLALFTHATRKSDLSSQNISQERATDDVTDAGDGQDAQVPGSNTSTLSNYTEKDSASSIASEDNQQMSNEYDIVKKVLYGNRENVNIMHEIFRQAFLFPFHHAGAIRRVINVYKDWLQDECKPVFMEEPSPDSSPVRDPILSPTGQNKAIATISEEGSKENSRSSSPAVGSHPPVTDPYVPRSRNNSYMNAVKNESISSIEDVINQKVKAGTQKVLQVFITNAANVFLLEPPSTDVLLEEQVDMCKRVLNIYRYMVMNHHLDQKTWEQLLNVLLKITAGVLSDGPPSHRERTRGGRLAQPLFQTLIVTWIKANLNVSISHDLWDHFLKVLSSLTQWVELIREWAKTMETLTRVLARQVYNLDLNDLPLDRLSEQKEKRRRAGTRATQGVGSPRSRNRERTFSRGWSRHEPVEKLRMSAGTAGNSPLRSNLESSSSMGSMPSIATLGSADNVVDGVKSSDGSRQRSASHEQSPTRVGNILHSGQSSAINIPRSSSDTNLVMDTDKKGTSFHSEGHDDQPRSETSDITTSGISQGTETSSLQGDELMGMDGDGDSLAMSYLSTNTDQTSLMSVSSHDKHMQESHNSNYGSVMSTEDHEVTSITSTVTDSTSVASMESGHMYAALERSGTHPNGSINYGKSGKTDADILLTRTSRSPSPSGSRTSELGDSRSHTPSEEDPRNKTLTKEDEDELTERSGKDSPTPDRESLKIDEMENLSNQPNDLSPDAKNGQTTEENVKSVLSGGVVVGWTADVAVILWRRMLGALGDINSIKDPEIHAQVLEYLCDLMDMLIKMRDNMSVTRDNQKSPPPPELLPPSRSFLPWLFEAVKLPADYKKGRLLAYRLLCVSLLKRPDIEISMPQLTRFYKVLHRGLTHSDQDTSSVLIRHCGSRLFTLPLPSTTLLTRDFIHAANSISTATELRDAPRADAVCVLGSLLCFPNHFGGLPVLQPGEVDLKISEYKDMKDELITYLLKAGKKEPAGLARCTAISSLGIFLYEELSHGTMHQKCKESINVLLATLRFNNKLVAQVAADMLMLLCDHVNVLLTKQPETPRRIIEVITNVISNLLPSTENSKSEEDKRLLISVMFVLLEWCMRLPIDILLDTSGGHKSLIYKTFRVLNLVVTGTQGTLTPRGSATFADFLQEEDLDNVRDISSVPSSPRTPMDVLPEFSSKQHLSPSKIPDAHSAESNMLKLAARTVISHLVNHMGHFPMGGGASQLHTTVQEHHDIKEVSLSELSAEVFNSPSVQFFVVNSSTLVSFVEIPGLRGVPGGGVTAGLTTGKTVTRVIVRDVVGKFSWDSTVLYGPPRCRAGSYPAATQAVLHITEDIDLLGIPAAGESVAQAEDSTTSTQSPQRRKAHELPVFSATNKEDLDNLHDMLTYIGTTSPECLLHPGEVLNIPFHSPSSLSAPTQDTVIDMVLQEKSQEFKYFEKHKENPSMVAMAMDPMENRQSSSPFQCCRLFLNQLGFMQWGMRPHFDLLKKSEKLLRELKNLDKQMCRETHKIAVIYVAKGQEDKQSILMNRNGSKQFEDFVAGLGWEVDLENHNGFMGGLQRNKSTGESAPYYATSQIETIFHVSTRMPVQTTEDQHKKLRHLGNDEVQIIWSEHTRDYRRGIIPTEFGDVLIIIYPLPNGLFRIHINRKPEIPFFGPLFHGAIVDWKVLPGLVRATALNASQVMRSLKPYYQSFFEERAKYVASIARQHKDPVMFEEFAALVFAPVLPQGLDVIGGMVQTSDVQMNSDHFTDDMDGEHLDSGKMSPQPSHKSKEESGGGFSRRLSFGKSKKSVTKQVLAAQQQQQSNVTPPDSPVQNAKNKK